MAAAAPYARGRRSSRSAVASREVAIRLRQVGNKPPRRAGLLATRCPRGAASVASDLSLDSSPANNATFTPHLALPARCRTELATGRDIHPITRNPELCPSKPTTATLRMRNRPAIDGLLRRLSDASPEAALSGLAGRLADERERAAALGVFLGTGSGCWPMILVAWNGPRPLEVMVHLRRPSTSSPGLNCGRYGSDDVLRK